MIKELLEDVCDNIFNPDPFFQQGGDMVRVGGLTYTCHPKNKMGKRISNLKIVSSDKPLESSKKYVVGGWGSVKPNVKGPAIYSLLENYITEKKIIKSKNLETVKIVGM
jgi:sulfur-oxidizing protein SoxB